MVDPSKLEIQLEKPKPLTVSSTSSYSNASCPTQNKSPNSLIPPIPSGNLTARGMDVANTEYPLSHVRTPLTLLPFPHPKWHMRPSTGQIYEVTSPILEEYDPVTGYIESVGYIRESVEGGDEPTDKGSSKWGEGQGREKWRGCVNHPESTERSSIKREAEKELDDMALDGRNKRFRGTTS